MLEAHNIQDTARGRGRKRCPPYGPHIVDAAKEGFYLEAVMNSIRKSLGMRETQIAREPSRLWNPHFYAVFAQVHNTL
jgi:hypothetical protein